MKVNVAPKLLKLWENPLWVEIGGQRLRSECLIPGVRKT